MADNTQLFINGYLGKPVDVDHYPPEQPFQCKDFIQKYVTECLALPPLPQGNAGDMWALAPNSLYLKIANTFFALPKEGDIIIWDKALNYDPKVGYGAGHIALKDATRAGLFSFTTADQNWSAPHVTLEKHNYKYVIGWLRKR